MGSFIDTFLGYASQAEGWLPEDWNKTAPEEKSLAAEEFEYRRCEEDRFMSRRGFGGLFWGSCPRPNDEASVPKSELDASESLSLEDVAAGLQSMAHSLLSFGGEVKHRLWDSQPEFRNFCSLAGKILVAFLSPADTDINTNQWKINQGVIRAALNFRGKDYDFRASDNGTISVNGKTWKLEGTTAATKMASVELESMTYNPDDESLRVEIKGSMLFVTKKIDKTLKGDQVEQILKALTESEGPIATPEMEKNGIRLVPV